MHFGFALDSPDIDLLNIDLSDTHLYLLDTVIPSKHFACLQDLLKTSSRHVFKASSRRIQCSNFSSSKRSSRRLARYLQDVSKTSWKTKNCYAGDLLKTSSRRLEDQQMFGGVFHVDIFIHFKRSYLRSCLSGKNCPTQIRRLTWMTYCENGGFTL